MGYSKNYFYLTNLICFIAAISFLIFSLPIISRAQSDGDDILKTVRNNVVKITVDCDGRKEMGFGFIVGERKNRVLIVTANHVVRRDNCGQENSSQNVVIEYWGAKGEKYDSRLLGIRNDQFDFAVLEAEFPQGSEWQRDIMGAKETIKTGEDVWFIGKVGKWHIPTIPGKINELSEDNVRIITEKLDILPGTSGAPLIAQDGIIGMIREDTIGSNEAISIYVIKNYFEKEDIPWGLKPSNSIKTVGKLCINLSTGERAIPLKVSEEDNEESYFILDSGECIDLKTGNYNIIANDEDINCKQENIIIKKDQKRSVTLECSSGVGKLCVTTTTGEKGIPLKVSKIDDKSIYKFVDSGECIDLTIGSYNINAKNASVTCNLGSATLKRGKTNEIVLNCNVPARPSPIPMPIPTF